MLLALLTSPAGGFLAPNRANADILLVANWVEKLPLGAATSQTQWLRNRAVDFDRSCWALLMTFAGCATTSAQTLQPNIYVMRHLQTPAGVTDPDLTDEGQRYAGLVNEWFRRDPPTVIYVSNTKRAQQTAEPLAQRLKLAPKVYNPADTPGLVASVLKESGTVLVVGHSNTVPEIIASLGGERPRELTHEDFGDIWHVAVPDRLTTHVRIE